MTHGSDTLANPEQQLPVLPVEHLSPEVYHTYDAEQIIDLMVNRLVERGVHPEDVVFCGFDAHEVLRRGSHGARSFTWAVGLEHMAAYERNNAEKGKRAEHSPVRYLESEGGVSPAIGVYAVDGLLGGSDKSSRKYLRQVDREELRSDFHLAFWATADGSSLDTVTKVIFAFDR